ncbi:protein cholesin isoform X3 [Rhinolophus sinicus]|uniref:protein cholesin isoform X3 n=2 Tax=Rhinolophus sinicus TaxID=89399 RepID=UPI003D79E621
MGTSHCPQCEGLRKFTLKEAQAPRSQSALSQASCTLQGVGETARALQVSGAWGLPTCWGAMEPQERRGLSQRPHLRGAAACRDPELSPELSLEEKRVLERKLKKERKKEERKRLREAGVTTALGLPAEGAGAQRALDYLRGWAQKHETWRFQKTRQTWLLTHMYDSDKVPEEQFPTLLAYLEGLKGQARELTVQKAEALMQKLDEAGASGPDPLLLGKTQRVRQVLQLLS